MSAFRRVCRWLHRELGYLAVGLTLVYAVSGIAVNHAHHWDANYSRTAEPLRIDPPGTGPTADVAPVVLARLALTEPVKNVWRASDTELKVFLEGWQYDVDLTSGAIVRHGFAKRPLLWDVNFMHLNSGKAPWTGIADVYAGVLVLLALSGIFLVQGSRGLAGRGGIMMVLGVLLPLLYGFFIRGLG